MNETVDPPGGPIDSAIGSHRVLHADPKKWRLVATIGGVFVAIGIAMIFIEGDFLAWFVTLFFLLVTVVGLIQLYGAGSYLELNADTFIVTNLGRRTTERWDECANFNAYRISRVEQVAYDRARDVDTHMGEMNRSISGRSAGLPDTFGMEAVKLADLMNAYQKHGVERSWQRHAEAVASYRHMIAEDLQQAGQPADIVSDPGTMTLPPEMQSWPSILAVLKEPRLDGSTHVLICADVLSPLTRWITDDTKRTEAFDLLGAAELQIIDPDTRNVRRFGPKLT